MLRNYALRFSQRGTQPGLLQDHAVNARAIRSGGFDAQLVLSTSRSFDGASFARDSRHKFFGSRHRVQLEIPTTS